MVCQFLLYSKVNQLRVYIYLCFFWTSFPFRLLQSTEQSSLCRTVGSYQLSVLCAVLCFSLSRVRLCATLWTVACQAPLSLGFSREEYWSGLLFPSPGDLPDPGIEPASPAFQADSLPAELTAKPILYIVVCVFYTQQCIYVNLSIHPDPKLS